MSVVEAWSLILGIVTPFVIALINNPLWSSTKKRVIAILVAAFIGVMNLLVNGGLVVDNFQWTPQNIIVNLALIIGATQTAYALVWQPTGVAPKVEQATSQSP